MPFSNLNPTINISFLYLIQYCYELWKNEHSEDIGYNIPNDQNTMNIWYEQILAKLLRDILELCKVYAVQDYFLNYTILML